MFLYSNEAYLKRKLLKTSEKKQDRSFNFTFRNIDVVLSLNSYKFVDFVDRIYSIEHEIKDTIYTARSDSYLDHHLEIDNECRLRTKLYDERDDLNIPIVNIPFICSNIPTAPAYGVYISQSIRYSRACDIPEHENGRFGALKSDSTHHFFRNACTKSGSLRFSQFFGC